MRVTGYLPSAPSVPARMGTMGALILFLSGCAAMGGSGSATPGSSPQQGVVYRRVTAQLDEFLREWSVMHEDKCGDRKIEENGKR